VNFKEYILLSERNTVGTHNDGPGAIFTTSDQSGSESSASPSFDGHPLHLPSHDLGLPTTTKTAKIKFMERNKNPILIYLEDGTKLYLNWDQFKRISGCKPEVGKTITVVFQRFPGDQSGENSQIQSLMCH